MLPQLGLTQISRKNSSQASPVPVQISTWSNTFVYERSGLLISYGLGLVCALTCAAFGIYAFVIKQASYQNIFSTFLRATQSTRLESLLEQDDIGADPLPERFANANIVIGTGTR